jgi:hypothetical protein
MKRLKEMLSYVIYRNNLRNEKFAENYLNHKEYKKSWLKILFGYLQQYTFLST